MAKVVKRFLGIPYYSEERTPDQVEERSSESGVSTMKNPKDWLANALGVVSMAGVNVTPEMAMQIPIFATCVRIPSETVAMLPFNVYKRDDEDNKFQRKDHPAYDLLHNRPNRAMNAFTWRQTMQSHAEIHGNGYSIIEKDALDRPVELKLIHDPREVTPFIFENELWYKVKGHVDPFPARDIFHIPGLSTDGIWGKPTTDVLKNILGLYYSVEKYGSRIFKTGGSKRVAFKTPGKVDEPVRDQIIKDWKRKYGEADEVHDPAFLQAGLDLVEIGINPEEAQLVEIKKALSREIVGYFRLQAHMVNDLERSTNNNIEQQALEFINLSMMPRLVRWEKEADSKMLRFSERKRNFTKFNVDAVLRGDFKTKIMQYTKAIQWGIYTPNQVLKMEDQNTYEGGDVHLFPTNMTTIEKMNSENKEN